MLCLTTGERLLTSSQKKLMHGKYKKNILEHTDMPFSKQARVCHTNTDPNGLLVTRAGMVWGNDNND